MSGALPPVPGRSPCDVFSEAASLPERPVDAYIISVGTPLKPGTKEPNLDYMTNVLHDVGGHLQHGCTVMLRSTVPVGFSRDRAARAFRWGVWRKSAGPSGQRVPDI